MVYPEGGLPGGVCLRELSAWGGLSARGVCLGVSVRGVHLPAVDRMTDACENITFPQLLLRTVTRYVPSLMKELTLTYSLYFVVICGTLSNICFRLSSSILCFRRLNGLGYLTLSSVLWVDLPVSF